jgi:hypothetical protein
MKKSKFTEEQIAYALRQVEGRTPPADVCRQLGVSEATFYIWKKKYAHLGVSELSEGPSRARAPASPRESCRTLTTPVLIPPCEELLRSRRGSQPRSDLLIEPGLLLVGVVHRHERPEAVRAHVTGHDQEIARRREESRAGR